MREEQYNPSPFPFPSAFTDMVYGNMVEIKPMIPAPILLIALPNPAHNAGTRV